MSDFAMFRGDTHVFVLAAVRDNAPVNLTGAKLWMSAKRSFPDTAYVFQLTSTGGDIVITPGTGGTATVTISPTHTAGLSAQPTTLVYDVQAKEADGTVTTFASGQIQVSPDVTTEIS